MYGPGQRTHVRFSLIWTQGASFCGERSLTGYQVRLDRVILIIQVSDIVLGIDNELRVLEIGLELGLPMESFYPIPSGSKKRNY